MSRLRDVLLVASADLRESLRSWRALLLLLVFAAGSVAASLIFIEVLSQAEAVAARALRVPATERPGALTSTLRESDELLQVLNDLIGDADVVREVLEIPPIALFYGWVALTFVPALATFVAGGSVASERASGAARFALARTDRTSWALGKLAGAALLLFVGLQLAAAAVWVVGALRTTGMPWAETALWLTRMAGRGWIYGLPWLGLAVGISQLTRSTYLAWGLCLCGLILGGLLRGLLNIPAVEAWDPGLVGAARTLLPGSHELDLWRASWVDRGPATAVLAAQGVVAFTAGHLRFLRADA